MVVPANQTTQPMKPKPSRMTSSSRQPRGDRQIAAEQAGAAVEQDREDRAADDQQQRLGKDDDPGDQQDHADPDRGAAHFVADHGIAEFGRPGPLDMLIDRRRPRLGISCS